MRSRTVIFSLIFHAAIAATLLGAAGKKALRKATSVAFTEEKKKAKPAPPKPPPPAPPKQVARPPERKVAAVSKALPEPVARAAAPAPVATALTMSNDDGPGGIALPTHAAAARPAAAAAAGTKVASAVTDARKQRLREAASAAGEDAPCEEEPSKPVLISQQPDIELTASARAEGIEGKLTLSLIIGEDGTVTGVKVVTSISPEMDAAAEAAVRQWRFKPAMACGKAVVGKFNLRKTFELGD